MGDEILRTKFRRPPTPPDIVPLFEESVKGSLEPGKLADLVMLDRNPLKVEPAAIKVMETIKAGKPVFTLGIPR
jgi:urease alpha subunit